jgi:hypothetical protein
LYVAGHDRRARRTSVSVGRRAPLVFVLALFAMMLRSSPPPQEDAGPFVAEDRPAELAEAIARFIATTRRGPVDRAVA